MMKHKLKLILILLALNNSYINCSYIDQLPEKIKTIINSLITSSTSQEIANDAINDLKNLSDHTNLLNIDFFNELIELWIYEDKDIEILFEALLLWPDEELIHCALRNKDLVNFLDNETLLKKYETICLKC